eukprot:m.26254 g.26254  ORF g.26254 m.26254 type:complete len:55 (-) comp11702_c0_seq1:1486-1650(-)
MAPIAVRRKAAAERADGVNHSVWDGGGDARPPKALEAIGLGVWDIDVSPKRATT